ncbi:MAG: Nif3-like dinuclear metal center hexameric protein [Bacteroidota bacterium]|nr:Nif3-like dinuclear metal center hexameric protein [Bacteroidota bacterium]
MKISDVVDCLESFAPLSLQEDYDNAGLLIGNSQHVCTGILTTLDVTEELVNEALTKKCNLIVAHHPIIFKGLKRLNGTNYVERTVISAIKNDIAVYAMHTNLDNVIKGVNKKIAEKLNLQNVQILAPKQNFLKKLVTFCPEKNAEEIRNALFGVGGRLGNYSECSFNMEGLGTYKAESGAKPYIGEIGKRHHENEIRIEVIFPGYRQHEMVNSLKKIHPYEEVAYDIYSLDNTFSETGSGLTGHLHHAISEEELLFTLKNKFKLTAIRHSPFLNKKITKIALCGGAGIFLLPMAKASGAEALITSDIKYHEFFDADSLIFMADIGHFESEQFTIELLADILTEKFPNFAVLKTELTTNPVNYYL